jgi:hypothetical protein
MWAAGIAELVFRVRQGKRIGFVGCGGLSVAPEP